MKRKCFILVGHSNWGKSETLRALTNGDVRTRHMIIPEINEDLWAYVRRISNDDIEESLIHFSGDLAMRIRQDYLILTFCPNIQRRRNSRTILENLQRGYDLFFFVLREDYRQSRRISEQEMDFINEYAAGIAVLDGHHEADVRANRFARFVRRTLS